jgi:membrane protease YdiL (CAAX protease family)
MEPIDTIKSCKRTIISSLILFITTNLLSALLANIILTYPEIYSNKQMAMLISFLLPITILPFMFLICKKHSISLASIGVSRNNLLQSLGMGLCLSLLLIFAFGKYNDIHNIIIGKSFTPASLFLQIIYYLIAISSVEEIVFRGFIRNNMFENREYLSKVLTGILFSLSHIPFHAIINHLSFSWFIFHRWYALLFYLLIHMFLQWFYDKYNNCSGPILLHFTINFFQIFSV